MLDGEIAYRYRNRLFGIALRKGFISSLNNKAWCVVNSDFADSQLYGEFVDQFDICCCVQYYGDKWVYHIRSSELNDIDVSAIAKEHGGGGHKHASGFSDDGSFFKELLNTKIKTMNDFIDAYEAAKRELEEEAKREEEEKERQRAMKLRENFLKGIK
jgi:nanoRNase/pAp phosphatase (c-di-AMP/oligoRNAs hydrolase)